MPSMKMYAIKKGENAGVLKNVVHLEVSYIRDVSKHYTPIS